MASKLMYMLVCLVSLLRGSELNCFQNGERVSMTRISPYALEGYPTLFNCTVTQHSPQDQYLFVWHLGGQRWLILANSSTSELNITLYKNHAGSNLTCRISSMDDSAACVINTVTPHFPESITLDVNLTQSCDNGSLDCRAYVTVGQHYRVTCNVSRSYPESKIKWFLNSTTRDLGPTDSTILLAEEDISQYKELGWKTSWVDLEIRPEHLNGIVICRVLQSFPDGKTVYKDTNMEFVESHKKNEVKLTLLIPVLCGSIIGVFIAVCITLYAVKHMRKKKERRDRDRNSPVELTDMILQTSPPPADYETPNIVFAPHQRCFPRDRINLLAPVGEGSFGVVYKATADGIVVAGKEETVAVKTLKARSTSSEVTEFMKELNICITLRPHPHIISTLGFNTAQEPYYLIFEFAANGNLQDFLRDKQNRWIVSKMASSSYSGAPVSSSQILKFACHIASGMEYLASMKIIHRDLAARNILLAEDLSCKISDFGFSRDVFFEGNYEMLSEGAVPIRWMALESVLQNTYTTKSDVWSYGVLLWEIITMGAHPYPGMDVWPLVEALKNGKRLPRPLYCGQKLYDIMKECWHPEPTRRPEFHDIMRRLYILYASPKRHLRMTEFKPIS